MPTDISSSSAWAATPASGSCGTNVTYTFDSTTGVLTISGTGAMYDYSYTDRSPFYCNEEIKEVRIAQGITTIGDENFLECSNLASIEIPYGVKSIGSSAFYGCSSLKSINYFGTEDEWNSIIIDENSGLDNIIVNYNYLPDRGFCGEYVTYAFNRATGELLISGIGDMYDYSYASRSPFYYNKEIKSVRIIEGVTSVGSLSFGNCINLTSIEIPNSVTSIGSSAFDGCSSLTNIEIPDGVTSIENFAFYACTSLTDIEIPSGVTRISDNAFEYCIKLTSVEIPAKVISIGSNAFFRCFNLISITIPDSVQTIDNYAFYQCNKLTNIYYHGAADKWDEITISSSSGLSGKTVHYNYHPISEIISSTDVTCEENGVILYNCAYGCEGIIKEIPATGHSIVQHAGKAPTSTEPGWEPYETCANCDYTTYQEIPATGPEAISGEQVVSVTAPVTGQTPQTTIEGEKYTGSIHWTPEVTDQFVKDTEYTAEITLTPKDGYQFDSGLSIKVNGQAADSTVNDDGTVTFSSRFEATVGIEYAGIQASKPEPLSKRAGKVVLEEQNIAEETVEYGYKVKDSDEAYTWQDSSTFENLEANTYDFAVRVKENDVHNPGTISDALCLEVFAKPVISYPDLTNLTVGTEIKDLVPALEGGSGTGTFDMEGVLPGGLSFDEVTGIISGTPNATGEAGSVSVKYTDSEGNVSDSAVVRYGIIEPAELKLNPEDIHLSYEKTIYDGTEKCPAVTINGLEQDQDYTVSYTNNINVGTATVTITGKGNYAGTASRTFEIMKGCTVSGQVKSYNPNNMVTIWLMQDGETVYEGTIEASNGSGQVTQDFRIEGVAEGTYDLKVMKEGHLTYTIEGVVVGNADVDLTASSKQGVQLITMLAGDMDGNGSINVNDLNTVWNSANYNKGEKDCTISYL